ncbi:embryonic protein UVS.2-like, partial [Dendropsophus ebraccatus]|uniref:embryonic protein UVS.2-like n=1 Tax=Dendropsophus ebraccatus TaxID=150705 RepID=UPI003831D328
MSPGGDGWKWPKSEDGTVWVPVVISSSFSDKHKDLIQDSMYEFESLTCVKFTPRTTEIDYINITSTNGCQANLGRVGGGQSVQLLAPGCMYKGIIQHELNHALGFEHENSRPDRDKYIKINYENIEPGSESYFYVSESDNNGLPYDYESVMHFASYAYSKDPNLFTIVPIPDPNVPIGQRCGLSVLDVAAINKVYDCNVCSTLLNTLSGELSSPNYPDNYSNNLTCVWLIRLQYGQVSLTFNDFCLDKSFACISDYITIYEGPSRDSPRLLNRICGNLTLPTIIVNSSIMLIEFVSDDYTTSVGFSASYKSVPCGGTFFNSADVIISPGYYSGSYPPNIDCEFYIYAPAGYKILLTGEYDIDFSINCVFDSL